MSSPKPLVAAMAVAAWAVAACGGGTAEENPPSPDAGFDGGASGQAFDPAREGPAPPIDGAVAGDTVTVLADTTIGDARLRAFDQSSPSTFDPTAAYAADTNSILSGLVTRSLTQYVYHPEQGSMVLVPDLATDLGTPNGDFTEWTFTIRDGVRFENGKTVTAENVAYGIKRSFDRDAFPDGPTYSNDYFLDGDTYKGPYTSGTQYAGVRVEGDTVTITMARPFPDMPFWGAFPAMGPIPEQGSEPDRYGLHPLATGPYKFATYTPGQSLTLVRNEEWDPDTDPGRHAYPDQYEFRPTPTRQIDAKILGGSEEGQTTLTYNNVLPGDYRQAQRLDRLTIGPTQCTLMSWPDYRDVTDIRVRQALGYAFPYDEVARLDGHIVGVTQLVGESILPTGFPGRQDYNVLETESADRTYPVKAKALLWEAGFAPGEFEVKFLYVADEPNSDRRRDVLVESYEAAGFQATPFGVPDEERFTVIGDPEAPINMWVLGWCSDWPSGASWFPPLFHSDGRYNYSGFSEPDIDTEIDRIKKLPFQEQPAEWGALDKTIMTDHYPTIITGYDAVAMLRGSRIGGMHTDYTGMPTWKDIHVVP